MMRVHRGPDRAACVEHVIAEHDAPTLDIERDVGAVDLRVEACRDIIAVEGDVQKTHGQLRALDLLDAGCKSLGHVSAAGEDADERHPLGTLVRLEDLVGDACETPLDGRLIHDDCFGPVLHDALPSPWLPLLHRSELRLSRQSQPTEKAFLLGWQEGTRLKGAPSAAGASSRYVPLPASRDRFKGLKGQYQECAAV